MTGFRIGREPDVERLRDHGYARWWGAVVATADRAVRDDRIDVLSPERDVYVDLSSPRPREAATLSAVAIAAHLERSGDHAFLVERHAVALLSHDTDKRFQAGMLILRDSRDADLGDADEPVRLLIKWLTTDAGDPAVSGHLARWVADHLGTHRDDLRTAWWRLHGLDLVRVLAAGQHGGAGRPLREQLPTREQLRAAVQLRWAAGAIGKTALADAAGISRPTLDTWL